MHKVRKSIAFYFFFIIMILVLKTKQLLEAALRQKLVESIL